MIRPALADAALLADVAQYDGGEAGFRIWWLGQSGFLLQWNRRRLLLDPYLSDSLTRKYAGTAKPHVRMTERVVAPEQLRGIDVATSSHTHTDHLDAETLNPLHEANPNLRLVIPEANREFVAARLGCDPAWPVGIDDGASAEVCGFRFTGIASAHEQLERDASGRHRYLGYVVSFGPHVIYHSGDTVLYEGMPEKLRRFSVDVALLPINGANPDRAVAGNLNGAEAAWLAKEIGARAVVPCHYEMFEFNTASPDEFVTHAHRLAQKYHILRNGEGLSFGPAGQEAGRVSGH
jgi:L-ascorbate metabolism protein UlaG (beta-lactamase superfamily)